MSPHIAVVGSVNTDLVAFVERLPEPGETLMSYRFLQAPGGKGANQAVAAARLGARVSFVAKVGEDGFGAGAGANLRREGMTTDHLVVDPQAPSGVALIFVDQSGHNMIVVASGANDCLFPEDVERSWEAVRSADLLLLQLETPLETVERAITLAAEQGMRVLLNPAPACHLSSSMLERVDWLTPNETEASALSGVPLADPEFARRAGEALLERGVSQVVITLGEQGAVWINDRENLSIPGFPVNAVDTTAAGDAFSAAFAVALGEGRQPAEAIRFANAVAALCVTQAGAQPSLPHREKVESFLRERSAE